MTDYSLAELSALTNVSARTIRYYISVGLLPSPGREGSATRYPATTLARLRLVLRLRDEHLPIAEIRRRLEELGDDDIEALLAAPTPAQPPQGALEYVRSLLASGANVPAAPAMPLFFAAEPSDLPSDPPSGKPPASPAQPAAPARSSTWERIPLTADLELHVRRPLSRRDNRIAERIVAFARQLLGEDPR